MSRKIKNLIIIFMMVVVLFIMFLTMNYAKNHIETESNQQNMNMEMPNGNNEMPQESDSKFDGELAEKPDGESNDVELSEKPDEGEVMEKPDEANDNESSEQFDDGANGQMDNSLEIPNVEMNMEMPNDNQMSNVSNLTYIYYIVFGIEAFVLAILVSYLIMSKFNKKTFKETFKNSDKIIILILSIIILAEIFCSLCIFITNNYVLKNSNNNFLNSDEMNNDSISYSAQNEITSDEEITSGEYSSSKEDENAILVSGNINTTLSNIIVNKTGDSDGGDNTSFYGTNSAVIAKEGANLTLKNINVITDATGANGVFCYGGSATTNNSSNDGTTITISDSTITTKKDNSGGIMTTGGGTTIASNLTITTEGISSAAIRSDRGGGVVTVDKGTYTTTGQGSPAIYSTADITVTNATLISKKSEGIVIEGKNKVKIENTTLTDSNTQLNGKSTTYKNIFLYQSMSGDAASGTAEFTAKNSTITTNNGDTIYVTNTTASINLENNTITNNDTDGNFLRVQKDSWGNDGSNGGEVTLVMTNQKVTGNIVIDSISTLDMTMQSNSYYEGTINKDNSAKSISLTLDENSSIKLTGDSYITSLNNSDSNNSNIDFNGYRLYVNGKEYK
jgi:hypothetical protein